MLRYNWEKEDWLHFTYSLREAEDELFLIAEKTGKVSGILNALPKNTMTDTIVEMIVLEAIKTSEIEGEYLSRKDVMSSIRNNLGLNQQLEKVKDKQAEGVSELLIDVRNTFQEPLSREKLFAWHKMLLKKERDITVGAWRSHTEPMQIVSGAMGKQTIHFEAPPSDRVPEEMEKFIAWFNKTGPGGSEEIKKAPLRAAIAHLYFESIHPFEDGNGRIGRAIAEKALSQGIGRPVLMSLSKTIEAKKNTYYAALEKAQRSNEITPWVNYFIRTVLEAQIAAEELIDFTLKKTRFFDRFTDILNERQSKAIRRMLEEGPTGFKGGMTASKYVSLTKTSKATATRDLQYLLSINAFIQSGSAAGRSTSYQVNL